MISKSCLHAASSVRISLSSGVSKNFTDAVSSTFQLNSLDLKAHLLCLCSLLYSFIDPFTLKFKNVLNVCISLLLCFVFVCGDVCSLIFQPRFSGDP